MEETVDGREQLGHDAAPPKKRLLIFTTSQRGPEFGCPKSERMQLLRELHVRLNCLNSSGDTRVAAETVACGPEECKFFHEYTGHKQNTGKLCLMGCLLFREERKEGCEYQPSLSMMSTHCRDRDFPSPRKRFTSSPLWEIFWLMK